MRNNEGHWFDILPVGVFVCAQLRQHQRLKVHEKTNNGDMVKYCGECKHLHAETESLRMTHSACVRLCVIEEFTLENPRAMPSTPSVKGREKLKFGMVSKGLFYATFNLVKVPIKRPEHLVFC